MEFYQGRPLEPEGPEAIRQQIEQFDTIEAINPEMRAIVEAQLAAVSRKTAAERQ